MQSFTPALQLSRLARTDIAYQFSQSRNYCNPAGFRLPLGRVVPDASAVGRGCQPVRFRMMASFVTFLFAVFVLYQQIVVRTEISFNLMDRVQHLSGIGSIRIDSLKQTIEFSSKAREIVGADTQRMAFDQFGEMLDRRLRAQPVTCWSTVLST